MTSQNLTLMVEGGNGGRCH